MKLFKIHLKKLLSKHEKMDYIQPTTYEISSKHIVLNDSIAKSVSLKNGSDSENIIDLVNKFYLETYSFKNLPKIYWGLIPTLIVLGIYLLKVLFNDFGTNNSAFYKEFLPHFIAVIMMILIIFIMYKNDKHIVKNFNSKYSLDTKNVNEVRMCWVKNRFGSNKDFYFLAERLVKWIDYKESININPKFKLWSYVYNSDAKTRIWTTIIALISLVTLIIINSTPMRPETPFKVYSILTQFINSSMGVSVLVLIVLLYFLATFMIWLLRTVGIFILDYIWGKGTIKDYKLRVMINFLLDNAKL